MAKITGVIRRLNGEAIPNATVRFTLPKTSYLGSNAYVSASIVETNTNNDGSFNLDIVPNSSMSLRTPVNLEIFEGTEKLESREVFIPDTEETTLEEIAAYSRQLLFKSPLDKFQGVLIKDEDITASFEFIGAGVKEEDLNINIGNKNYTIPTYLINGGQG